MKWNKNCPFPFRTVRRRALLGRLRRTETTDTDGDPLRRSEKWQWNEVVFQTKGRPCLCPEKCVGRGFFFVVLVFCRHFFRICVLVWFCVKNCQEDIMNHADMLNLFRKLNAKRVVTLSCCPVKRWNGQCEVSWIKMLVPEANCLKWQKSEATSMTSGSLAWSQLRMCHRHHRHHRHPMSPPSFQVWLLQSTGRVAPDDVGQLSDGKSELGGERTKLHVVRCKWNKHGCFITPNTVGWISGVNFDPKSPLFTHKAYMRKIPYRRDWH